VVLVLARQTQTRDRLIRTSAELFWRQGYAHTGVSVIMKRAKATSGSLYHFFPTKDDLLLAVIDTVRDRVEVEVLDAAEAASSLAAGRVASVVAAYRDHTTPDDSGFGLPVGALVHELGSELEEARRRVAGIYERMVRRITAWLEADSPTSGDELRSLAESIVAALEGAALMAVATHDSGLVDTTGARVLRWVNEGREASGHDAEEMPPSADTESRDWKAW
jgi:AcrR family transcriptional regulator